MHSNSKRVFGRASAQHLGLAGIVAMTMGLAACGGGSDGVSGVANPAIIPPAIPPKTCNNIAGNLDVLQTALTGQLRPAVQSLPTVGVPAAAATTALSQTLDTVDAISNALTTLARTQNPQQFSAQLTGAGDSLLCSGATLSDALSQLASSQSVPIPGLSVVQQTLATASQRVADGLVGTAPGGDLTLLTNQLVALAAQLKALSGNLPTQVNQPYLREVLALNATAFDSLALILNDLGTLNGAKLSNDVTALLLSGATSLPVSLATQFGVPTSALSPVTTQFTAAAQAVSAGVGAVAAPTLQAVSAVLGAANGTALGTAALPFADLIDGSLTSTGSTASVGRVTQVAQQLTGVTGGLTLVTALLQSFGGVLPPLGR